MDRKTIIEALKIDGIKDVRLLKKGFQNKIYTFSLDGKKICLRLTTKRDRANVEYEIMVLNRLPDLPVPHPLVIDGRQIFRIAGGWATLYPYIEGESIKKASEGQLVEVAKTVAMMHNNLVGASWKKKKFEFYNLPDSKIRFFENRSRKARVKYLGMLPEVIKELRENRLADDLPKGAIHVDLGPGNMLFSRGKLSGIIDFDNGYIGPMILDIGKMIMFFASDDGKFYPEKAKTMIKAYMDERRLTKKEYLSLYRAIKYAFLSHIFMDYYMRAIRYTPQRYFEWIINSLYVSYKDFKMDEKEFYKFLER